MQEWIRTHLCEWVWVAALGTVRRAEWESKPCSQLQGGTEPPPHCCTSQSPHPTDCIDCMLGFQHPVLLELICRDGQARLAHRDPKVTKVSKGASRKMGTVGIARHQSSTPRTSNENS